jgi:hypothetical protein
MVLYLCIACDREVRPRQHAISCDICERGKHRLCDTGITFQEYNLARQDNQLQLICRPCEELLVCRRAGSFAFGDITTSYFLKMISDLYKPTNNQLDHAAQPN